MCPALVVKSIKPQKLRQDEFRLEFLNVAHKVGRGMLADFEQTTESFAVKPEFETVVAVSSRSGTVEVMVGTDDENYVRLNDGAPPHLITARNKPTLRFRTGYVSKTLPGQIMSRKGGAAGPHVSKRTVQHPGFEGRHFDETIAETWQPRFLRLCEEAMRRAAAKSRHSL